MQQRKNLSDEQKKILHRLEYDLNSSITRHDLSQAAIIVNKAHRLLKPIGQNYRLAIIKCRYCEFLVNEHKEQDAIRPLDGIRRTLNPNTRGYLEATALLAICYLRLGKTDDAKILMKEVLKNDTVIKSDFQRRHFQKIIVLRFDEEIVLANLREDITPEKIDAEKLYNDSGKLLYECGGNEDQLYEIIGEKTPYKVKQTLYEIEVFSQKQLPNKDILLLPSPDRFQKNREEMNRRGCGGFVVPG